MEHAADERYPGTTVAAAALATIFFPLVSLIAALFLLGRERNEAKRSQLRTWAWAAAAWIALQFAFFLVILLLVTTSTGAEIDQTGPCVGGPVMGEGFATDENGVATVPCAFGGSETITIPG